MSLNKFIGFAVVVALLGFMGGCAQQGGKMTGVSLGATGGLGSLSVNRGRSVVIGTFLHWDKNCWAATIPKVKIVKRPKFGSVRINRGNMMITKTECKGIPIKGSKLTYRGSRRGVDEFSYSISSGPEAGIHTVRVTVK